MVHGRDSHESAVILALSIIRMCAHDRAIGGGFFADNECRASCGSADDREDYQELAEHRYCCNLKAFDLYDETFTAVWTTFYRLRLVKAAVVSHSKAKLDLAMRDREDAPSP
jgi:hypothetical protein